METPDAPLLKQPEITKQDKMAMEFLKDIDIKNAIVVLMALLDALTRNVMSGDIWYLSYRQAIGVCKQIGMPNDEIDAIIKRIDEYRFVSRQSNPLHSMFD